MNNRNNQLHAFHLIDPSLWPILSGFSALILTFGFVSYVHGYSRGFFLFFWGLFMVLAIMFLTFSLFIQFLT
jgi:hypothetical protein